MADKKPLELRTEVLPEGIKVWLGKEGTPYWILFTSNWDNLSVDRFTNKKNSNLDALVILLKKVVDWNFVNGNWESIPFEKEKIISGIDLYQKGESDECFTYPVQFEEPLVTAYFAAISAARKLSIEKKV